MSEYWARALSEPVALVIGTLATALAVYIYLWNRRHP